MQKQPEATKPALTVEVVAEFMLGGQPHDTVRVMWTGVTPPTLEDAVRAADTADRPVVRTNEEWSHAYEYRRDLPLPEKPYRNRLATTRPDPVGPRCVSVLDWGRGGWYRLWGNIDRRLDVTDLVLRRRT